MKTGKSTSEASKATPTKVNLHVSNQGAPVKSSHSRAVQGAIRGQGNIFHRGSK
jgi:hypothetical protein